MPLYQVTDTSINQSYTSMIHIRSDIIAGVRYETFRSFYTDRMYTFRRSEIKIQISENVS